MLYDPKWKPKDEVVILRDDLSKSEIWALLRVREALKSGEISAKHFQMDTTFDKQSCGTVGCIGGWMGIFTALKKGFSEAEIHDSRKLDAVDRENLERCFLPIEEDPDGIYSTLFYPMTVPGRCKYNIGRKATPQDGVNAIENFLRGETYPWKDWKPQKKEEGIKNAV